MTATAGLKLEPYAFEARSGERVEAELGRLRVPETRGRAHGPTLDLAFVRFPTTAARPGPPLIYLVGGPGGSGIDTARGVRFPLFMAMRELGDVIALDQRGTGMSRPHLRVERSWDFPLDRPGDPQEMGAIGSARLAEARDEWAARGVNPSAYNTNENADDVDALRRALGAESARLWGSSYGTHLTFATIRRHAAQVAGAVLVGAEGPDHTLKLPSQTQRGLERVARLCRADPEVSVVVPDLLDLVRRVLEPLAHQPVSVDLDDGAGARVTLVLGKYDLQLATSNAVGRVPSIRMIPALYQAASRGDFRALAAEILDLRRGPIYSLMSYTMDCASGASKERLERIRAEASQCLLGDAANFPLMDVCSGLGPVDLGPEFRSRLQSEVPVLFISGTLDARTPPENAEEMRAQLPNSAHLVLENAGHDEETLLSAHPAIRDAMLDFFRRGPSGDQRISLPAPRFAPFDRTP